MKTYSVKEVAEFLKVAYRTVLKLIKTGKLKAYKVGAKIYRITGAELQKFINGGIEDGINGKY
jgi:excisionase family DNA binding protein